MSSTKSQTLLVGYWLFSAVILLAVIELLLVFFWNNPYRLSNSHPVYTRFHPSNLLAYAAIHDRLYSGEYRVRIYVEPDMSISSGTARNDTAAICIGGSTTESALVPEGQRWPDLLQLPAKNFGVSGSTSIDGYFNLKYLIESAGAKPQVVFLMFAVNDLRAFLSKGAEGFTIEGWNEPMGNALVEIDSIDDHVLFGLRIRDSALLSFIRYEANNIRGREFFSSYYAQRQAQAELPVLSDGEFRGLFDAFVDDFLPRRKRVYEEIDRVARTHGLELYLLAQPHAYTLDFSPYRADLRLLPRWRDKKMSFSQAAVLMDMLNSQSRELALTFGWHYVDVPACFSRFQSGDLFYDSVHYTLQGSKQFADCVNRDVGDGTGG